MEEDFSHKLLKMVEGSDFDKKMDEMFEKMLAKGMTEEQIMQ